MAIKKKLQVTGFRWVWGEAIDDQRAFEYIRAYAKLVATLPGSGKKKILVGRDTRPSGRQILCNVYEAFEKEGVEVVNAGIIPTPSILLLVKKKQLDGGVIITASHNPVEYNGIKFVVSGGRLTNETEVREIESLQSNLKEDERHPTVCEMHEEGKDNHDLRKIHLDEILKNIDVALVKSKKFKVALDPINGAGSVIAKELLQELGCTLSVINDTPDGNFAHPPEPLAQNLSQIMQTTKEHKADIGFALDPDADRLATVDEGGNYISEEHTLVLIIKNILAREAGDIVINISSSKMSEDVAKEFGRKTFKSKVGEANVLQKMLEVGAVVGGEGGGGGIYPKINTARDGLVCLALILELMARENKKIGEIVAGLPKYCMLKDKVPVTDKVDSLYEKLKKQFPEAETDEIDGVRFDWPDETWVIVRASITEPIIRIVGEAREKNRIATLFDEIKLTLSEK
jgi:phosphomannomutase